MSSRPPIPLFSGAVSVQAQEAALAVLQSGQIASGPMVERFEQQFGSLCGRPHVVATNDMTSALALALRLAGVGVGDEVLTLAYSCMSSNSAIAHVGATPVWVDIDPASGAMDIEDVRRALTGNTKAVMLYHVAGYPGPVRALADLCRQRGMVLIEDCNNALGSTVDGKPVGQLGDYAVWSLYPNRQINALEGGVLACPSAESAARARRLRRFGIDAPTFRDRLGEINPASDIAEVGYSMAFSQLNAAVGLAHLQELPPRLARTAAFADQLGKEIAALSRIRSVQPLPGSSVSHWAYLVRAQDRDGLLAELKSQGVHCSKLHQRNDTYTGFKAYSRQLPGIDTWMREILALPCGHWLAPSQQQELITILGRVCN